MGLGKERWSGDDTGFWSRERTVALALFLLTTLALGVCFIVLRPFLAPLAWAVALAVAAYPVYHWLEEKLHRKGLAAGGRDAMDRVPGARRKEDDPLAIPRSPSAQ